MIISSLLHLLSGENSSFKKTTVLVLAEVAKHVFYFLSSVMMKHHGQKQLGEERVYFRLQVIDLGEPRQELKQRPWRSATNLLVVTHDLPSYLSYTTQDHLSRCATAHSELNPPISIINLENAL